MEQNVKAKKDLYYPKKLKYYVTIYKEGAKDFNGGSAEKPQLDLNEKAPNQPKKHQAELRKGVVGLIVAGC